MIDPTVRIANYTKKVTAVRSSTTVGARLSSMVPNAAQVQNSLYSMEAEVRTVLNAAGQPTIMYPFYLNFGRELWALRRRGVSGESLAIEAAVLIAKWVAQGLVQATLQDIRTDVFTIPAPAAP
jgi:hypothetical protein